MQGTVAVTSVHGDEVLERLRPRDSYAGRLLRVDSRVA